MKPIFSTGTARGGTGLLTRMLSVSDKVEIALDPYLALYRSARTAIVDSCEDETIKSHYDAHSSFHDYYFNGENQKLLNLIMQADLNIPYKGNDREAMMASLKKRAELSSGDLISHMENLQGSSYKELFEAGLQHIRETRKCDKADWIGIHENWTIEFLPALARTFPEAKFFIITRDPRAVITSNMRVEDPQKRGQILSYARALRKLMAFAYYLDTEPLFEGRLKVVRYEDLVLEPKKRCKELCAFLEIDYSDSMLDTDNYVEPSTGAVYNGFSSYEKQADGINEDRIHRWKKHLPENKALLIDFLCGPEMSLFGYEKLLPIENPWDYPSLLETLEEDLAGEKSWRCDYNFIQQDLGYELFRHYALKSDELLKDEVAINRSFLFSEVYSALK